MYSLIIFIFGSACLLNILPFGDTLQCYHCDEVTGKDCDNPVNNKNYLLNCSSEANEVTCFIRTMVENGTSKIQRGCGPVNPCISGAEKPVFNDTSICTKCDSDLCNGKKNSGFSNFNVNFLSILLSSIMYFGIKKLL